MFWFSQENIAQFFPRAQQLVRDARERRDGAVFVHCAQGISRSTTIVCSVLFAGQASPVLRPLVAAAVHEWKADSDSDSEDSDHEGGVPSGKDATAIAARKRRGRAPEAKRRSARAKKKKRAAKEATRQRILAGAVLEAELLTMRETIRFVKSRREVARPNSGFLRQLGQLEARLRRGRVTVELPSPTYVNRVVNANIGRFALPSPKAVVGSCCALM